MNDLLMQRYNTTLPVLQDTRDERMKDGFRRRRFLNLDVAIDDNGNLYLLRAAIEVLESNNGFYFIYSVVWIAKTSWT